MQRWQAGYLRCSAQVGNVHLSLASLDTKNHVECVGQVSAQSHDYNLIPRVIVICPKMIVELIDVDVTSKTLDYIN